MEEKNCVNFLRSFTTEIHAAGQTSPKISCHPPPTSLVSNHPKSNQSHQRAVHESAEIQKKNRCEFLVAVSQLFSVLSSDSQPSSISPIFIFPLHKKVKFPGIEKTNKNSVSKVTTATVQHFITQKFLCLSIVFLVTMMRDLSDLVQLVELAFAHRENSQ